MAYDDGDATKAAVCGGDDDDDGAVVYTEAEIAWKTRTTYTWTTNDDDDDDADVEEEVSTIEGDHPVHCSGGGGGRIGCYRSRWCGCCGVASDLAMPSAVDVDSARRPVFACDDVRWKKKKKRRDVSARRPVVDAMSCYCGPGSTCTRHHHHHRFC